MKTINLNEKQVVVLKSLLEDEIEYLSEEAIPSVSGEDKESLQSELDACNKILKQLNK